MYDMNLEYLLIVLLHRTYKKNEEDIWNMIAQNKNERENASTKYLTNSIRMLNAFAEEGSDVLIADLHRSKRRAYAKEESEGRIKFGCRPLLLYVQPTIDILPAFLFIPFPHWTLYITAFLFIENPILLKELHSALNKETALF
ncbi:predicted protein [Lichtheimia corymbifera JMRC:FSU:9682]|uniref:Uncharacterized protein n=1 Tax=Lichtheimia corymbifera JMRC:FSU:9682 TaxID=1263082 RepID=A0A068RR68_9FUNG|nr:predicted protein [Lichtheimia corymbifera JMRC:FSU:9682]